MEPHIIIGQILGIIAVIISAISYQAKTQKSLLLINLAATTVIATHYLLLGSYAGAIMNAACILRNVAFCYRDKRFLRSSALPYVMAGIIVVVGCFSWGGPADILLLVALAVNTVFMSFDNAQTIRKSVILTSSLILIYNVILGSFGGCANEVLAISSAIIGVIRFRSKKEEEAESFE